MHPTKPAQPIKLYSSPLSGHAHRVRVLLSILELPHEIVDVDLRSGAHKQPSFLAKNPLGQVPVIEDGEVTVYDSTAILVYLALRYDPSETWLPRDPVKAAEVQRWLGLASGPVAFGPNRARLAILFGAPVDHAQAEAVATTLLGNLDRELSDKRFAIGHEPTIADIAVCSYVALSPEGNIPLDPYPHVQDWIARVEAVPGFVEMTRSR
jgi:glutathione S-transferase